MYSEKMSSTLTPPPQFPSSKVTTVSSFLYILPETVNACTNINVCILRHTHRGQLIVHAVLHLGFILSYNNLSWRSFHMNLVVQMQHDLFIQLLMDGHLDCFLSLDITNDSVKVLNYNLIPFIGLELYPPFLFKKNVLHVTFDISLSNKMLTFTFVVVDFFFFFCRSLALIKQFPNPGGSGKMFSIIQGFSLPFY